MEAALITGKLSGNFLSGNAIKKDVEKAVDFKDVFSKATQKEDVKSEGNEKIKDVTQKGEEKTDNVNEEGQEEIKEVDDKVKKKDDKIKKREKIIENINELSGNADVNKQDVGRSVEEVGPRTVETETITLNMKENDKNIDVEYEGYEGKEITFDKNEDVEDENIIETVLNKDVEKQGIGLNKNNGLNEDKGHGTNKGQGKEGKLKIRDFRNNSGEVKIEEKLDKEDNIFTQDVENIGNEVPNEIQERIEIIEQVTDSFDASLFDDKSEMVIKLKPENLGKLTVKVSLENGVITAKFLAESDKVKEALESNFQNLKETLQNQGINVQDVSVSVGNDNNREMTFERRRRAVLTNKQDRIENVGRINGFYENDEITSVRNYWPGSTVSFSA